MPDVPRQVLAQEQRRRIGGVVVVYKLVDEYITHVGNIDRSELLQRLLGG